MHQRGLHSTMGWLILDWKNHRQFSASYIWVGMVFLIAHILSRGRLPGDRIQQVTILLFSSTLDLACPLLGGLRPQRSLLPLGEPSQHLATDSCASRRISVSSMLTFCPPCYLSWISASKNCWSRWFGRVDNFVIFSLPS